jgi:DNA methylase
VTPYFDEGGITIYHGDCREILPTLGTFDLTLTDPPYGTGGKPHNGAGRSVQRRAWASSGAPKLLPERAARDPRTATIVQGDDLAFDPAPLLRLAPAAVLWGAHWYADKLPPSPMWLAWDRKCGRAPKTTTTDVELAWVYGHRFRTVRLFRHMWAGLQRDSETGQRSLHPTQKPVPLMAWCLSFFPEARTVVDPYMGSGPVAKACADAGLRYVGIELVEEYCERAVARLAQRTLTA